MLCYAMLCYAMLCCAMLCDAMRCDAMRCDALQVSRIASGVHPWWLLLAAPLAPLMGVHDATVSVLRAYSAGQLRHLAADAAQAWHRIA